MDKLVIELIRVSTEAQAGEDRGGIPAQHEANLRTARACGLTIMKTIEIKDVSGASVLRCPEMAELLSLMEDREICGVLTKEFSRLMRPENFNDYFLLQHFIKTGCQLYLPDGPIDLASKNGRFLGTIRAAMAGLERREINERMRDGKEALRRAGKNPNGWITLPYGVAYSKKDGWSFTADAEKVKQAFALFLEGNTSYTEIAKRLNLSRSNLRFILQNPIYKGIRLYHERRDPTEDGCRLRPDGRQPDRRKVKRAPDEIIQVRVLKEGLVSESDFAQVQRVIDLKRQKHWRVRNNTKHHYIYNGFLTCGDQGCGCLIYTQTSTYDFYSCSSRNTRERRRRAEKGLMPCTNRYMLRKKLEPKIDYLLGRKLLDPEFLKPVISQYNEKLQAPKVPVSINRAKVEGKLKWLGEKRNRVLGTYYDKLIDAEERDRLIQQIDREISTYQELISKAPAEQPIRRPLDLEAVRYVLSPLTEWEFLDREGKRRLLPLVCPEISVYQYQIKSLSLNLIEPAGNTNELSQRKTDSSP